MKKRGIKCGLGDHTIKGTPVKITNTRHINFIRKRQKEFRSDHEVCARCYNAIKTAYSIKYERAVQNYKRHKSSTVSSVTESDSIDRLVNKRAKNEKLYATRRGLNNNRYNVTDESTSSSSLTDPNFIEVPPNGSNNLSQINMTSTQSTGEDDSSVEYIPSINVLKGLRLPHVQPVPKRHPVIHLNKDVMDIYLANTTGG